MKKQTKKENMCVRLDGDDFTVVKSSRHFRKGKFNSRRSSEFVQLDDAGFTVAKSQRDFFKGKIRARTERVGTDERFNILTEAGIVERKMDMLRKMAKIEDLGLTETIDIKSVDAYHVTDDILDITYDRNNKKLRYA